MTARRGPRRGRRIWAWSVLAGEPGGLRHAVRDSAVQLWILARNWGPALRLATNPRRPRRFVCEQQDSAAKRGDQLQCTQGLLRTSSRTLKGSSRWRSQLLWLATKEIVDLGDETQIMSKFSRWIPLIGGAVAGGVIALVIASGETSTSSKSVTTTVDPSGSQAALPASFNKGSGRTVNQIYRTASPGVVDIIVTSQPEPRASGSSAAAAAARPPRVRAPASSTTRAVTSSPTSTSSPARPRSASTSRMGRAIRAMWSEPTLRPTSE